MAVQSPQLAQLAGGSDASGALVALAGDLAVLAGFVLTTGATQVPDAAALAATTGIAGSLAPTSHALGAISGATAGVGSLASSQKPNTMGGAGTVGTIASIQQANTDDLEGSPLVFGFLRGDLFPQQPNTDALAGVLGVAGQLRGVSSRATARIIGAVASTGSEAATQMPGTDSLVGGVEVAGGEAAIQAPNTADLEAAAQASGISALAVIQQPNTGSIVVAVGTAAALAGFTLNTARLIGTVAITGFERSTSSPGSMRTMAGPIAAGPLAGLQQPNTDNIVGHAEIYTLIGVISPTQAPNVARIRGNPDPGAKVAALQAPNTDRLQGSPLEIGTLAGVQKPNSAQVVAAIISAISGTIVARNTNRAGMVGQPRVIGAEAAIQAPNTMLGQGDAEYGVDACYLLDEARPIYLLNSIACACEC